MKQKILVGSTCADHTACPEGYIQWHSWAARMMKTHNPYQCGQCGLWKIWLPKKAKAS